MKGSYPGHCLDSCFFPHLFLFLSFCELLVLLLLGYGFLFVCLFWFFFLSFTLLYVISVFCFGLFWSSLAWLICSFLFHFASICE